MCSQQEQQKIGNFFSILDTRIEQQEQKLTLLNKYKRGMILHVINEINNTSSYPFNELFIKYNCKNKDGYLQYTIGVNGIKQLESDRNTYDISKHKCFEPNSLILGIGINEIGISNCYGCCSPVYSTYKINTEIAVPDFIKYYIPIIFNKNKGLITRKSTRREFEFTKDIKNLTILLPDIKEQIKIANLLETINLNIEKENKLLILLKQYKQGLLQQMFI